MRRLCFSILITILGICSYGQTQGVVNPELPSIVPASPEASSLGNYGELPVNLSTGKINHTIPLHQIVRPGFSLPIALSYNYSGLMVESIPSSVGLGWDMTAKGMITRQVRGIADEDQLGFIGLHKMGEKVFNYNTNPLSMTNQEKGDLIRNAASGRWDTESDKYMISVGNLSATFYFDHHGEAVFVPYKNYKLKRIEDGFELTDDAGIVYFFNYKETTSQEAISADSFPKINTSAWVLSKVRLISGEEITFSYTGYETRQITYSDSKSEILPGSSNMQLCLNESNIHGTSKTRMFNEVFGLLLTKIETNTEIVHFSNRKKDALQTKDGENPMVLERITIENKFGNDILSYDFEYNDLDRKYKLLNNIKRGKTTGVKEFFYEFEYMGVPPEDIAYYKQDYWGYYNGNNNVKGDLISENGNRSSNFNTTKLGALKKIIYPTKGYTELLYEPNEVFADQDLGEININEKLNTPIKVIINSDNYPANQFITEQIKIPFKPDIIPGGGGRVIELQYYLHGSGQGAGALLQLKRIDQSVSPIPCSVPGSVCNSRTSSAISEQFPVTNTLNRSIFYLEPGEYELEVFFERPGFTDSSTGSPRAVANVSLKYFTAVEDDNEEEGNVSFGGLRIQKVISCNGEGECITKRYEYKDENNKSTGLALSKPNYVSLEQHNYVQAINPFARQGKKCLVRKKSSTSNIPLATYIGSPVLYKEVIEYQQSNNGEDILKKVHHFSGNRNIEVDFPFASIDQKNWEKGNLTKEVLFSKENSTFNEEQINESNYSELVIMNEEKSLISNNLKVGQYIFYYSETGKIDFTYAPEYFGIVPYTNKSIIYNMISSKQTLKHQTEDIVTELTYNYESDYGQIRNQINTNSKDEVTTSTMKYAYDVNDTRLIAENRLITAVEQEVRRTIGNNTIVLGKQKTIYTNSHNNADIYLPEKIQTSKGSQILEDRLVYHSYDNLGNPTEVSKKDGTSVVYIWGYNQTQPIAKIEGVTLSIIPSATITNLQALSNSDNDRTLDYKGKEGDLREALDALRSLPELSKALITTYTYDPLIGVTSITDSTGYVIYYQYDNLNRLEFIKDAAGNIVQETQYNYKN